CVRDYGNYRYWYFDVW
nr:immunoglobulin heavy chain junction region [Mus musculus]MBK4189961.1 immunoglobulin heavy chain junction region [Mus musculus]